MFKASMSFLAIHMNHFRRITHFHLLLLGNIWRLGKHPWPPQYKWLLWQQIKIYSLFFCEYLYMPMQSIYNQKEKVMFQSLELLPWKQSLKIRFLRNNWYFPLTSWRIKLISNSRRQFKWTVLCSFISSYSQLHMAIYFVGYPSLT